MTLLLSGALILGGYLLGSIATAVIVCRMLKLPDPREQGSGNPGATNVLRIGGKKAAAITLIGDFLKGLLPVAITGYLSNNPLLIAAVGLAAFLGHLYPLFFAFRGGKGVATALGVILGFSPLVAIAAAITWLVIAYGLRISSAAALVSALITPLYMWWLGLNSSFIAVLLIMAGLLIWRHRSNIQRLLAGRENRLNTR